MLGVAEGGPTASEAAEVRVGGAGSGVGAIGVGSVLAVGRIAGTALEEGLITGGAAATRGVGGGGEAACWEAAWTLL